MKSLSALAAAVGFRALSGTPVPLQAASHREAPITALDHKADITDVYAFVSYDDPNKVTLIMDVDPLLEPSNGPNYFPFDEDITYAIRVDNNNDAVEDVVFEFRFQTEVRAPGLFTGFAGVGTGLTAPANSPAPVAPGTPLVPPAITALDGDGSQGLSLRQTYTVSMLRRQGQRMVRTDLGGGRRLIALPSNVGPRTMPDYPALFEQAVFSLDGGVKVFAGTVDDPFWIDVGAVFDTLNFRPSVFSPNPPGVLSAAQDGDDDTNFAPDNLSGFNVNSMAIEVPITMLTSTGAKVGPADPAATIGVFGTTSRPRVAIRRSPRAGESERRDFIRGSRAVTQVQRLANPLFNELIIGTGSKDKWSLSQPRDDAQFADFALDPLLARVLNAVYREALPIPAPPRQDLLILVKYQNFVNLVGSLGGFTPPTVQGADPVADLLRLNTGIPATPLAQQSRLGPLGGDFAGWPNGRRVTDDVTDVATRAVAGVLAGDAFNDPPHSRLGDGVNANDVLPYRETFPYVKPAHSGRNRRHVDPGEQFPDGREVPVD